MSSASVEAAAARRHRGRATPRSSRGGRRTARCAGPAGWPQAREHERLGVAAGAVQGPGQRVRDVARWRSRPLAPGRGQRRLGRCRGRPRTAAAQVVVGTPAAAKSRWLASSRAYWGAASAARPGERRAGRRTPAGMRLREPCQTTSVVARSACAVSPQRRERRGPGRRAAARSPGPPSGPASSAARGPVGVALVEGQLAEVLSGRTRRRTGSAAWASALLQRLRAPARSPCCSRVVGGAGERRRRRGCRSSIRWTAASAPA